MHLKTSKNIIVLIQLIVFKLKIYKYLKLSLITNIVIKLIGE